MTLDYTVRNPLLRVLRAYDRAIHACEVCDAPAANRAIALLRASHDGESPESLGFEGIFVWCVRALADGDFEGPARRLGTLRKAWSDSVQVRANAQPDESRPALRLMNGSP
ncbi:MAG: hypothetical protein H7Z40_05465 [Phycisphaerae bacterium]|nr:hypothetical protein [Gemmatimonadaceae bacterium]